jgi:hypothetical protein
MTTTTTPSLAEFDAALDSLVIVWPRDGQPSIGPLSDPTAEMVVAWVESVLDANPGLVAFVWQRFTELPEVVPGLRVLPVAGLREALLTTLQHGTYVVGMGAA